MTSFHQALPASLLQSTIVFLFSTLLGKPVIFSWLCLKLSLVADSLHFLTIILRLVWIPVSFPTPFSSAIVAYSLLDCLRKKFPAYSPKCKSHLFEPLWQLSSPYFILHRFMWIYSLLNEDSCLKNPAEDQTDRKCMQVHLLILFLCLPISLSWHSTCMPRSLLVYFKINNFPRKRK